MSALQDRKKRIPPQKTILWYFVALIITLFALQYFQVGSQKTKTLTYSRFETYLHERRVASITISDSLSRGEFKNPLPDGTKNFVVHRVSPELARQFTKYGVSFSGESNNNILFTILSWIVPMLVFFGLWILFFRGMGGGSGMGSGLMAVGKSKAKIYVEKDTKVSFNDVAGVDEAKEELEEIVTFLKNPGDYGRLGARIPKGVLLVGPPGTGKTLLARAVAGEAGVPFFSISGSEFVELFVGVGAARVRDLFEKARARQPAIIFIDELDALGSARGAFPMMGGHDEKEQTLNQLLSELDGFDPRSGLVLLAATNRPEILDPALLRAGRFDRQVLVDRPDRGGRAQIAAIYLKKISVAEDVSADTIASLTPGFTGADIENLINEAALHATRRMASKVAMSDFTAAVERIVAGLEKKSRILSPHEKETVAYHEMGHALVALSLPGSDVVHKVSIIPRGIGSLGYTIQRPTGDRYLMTRQELENKMAILLGGRAAEAMIFHEFSTGAADDLVKVTDIARSIVTQYGMDEKLGNVAYERQRATLLQPMPGAAGQWAERDYSEETAREIDCAVRRLVDQAFSRATALLERYRKALELGARELLQKETLTENDLAKILDRQSNDEPQVNPSEGASPAENRVRDN